MHPDDAQFPCRIPVGLLRELAEVVVATIFQTSTPGLIVRTRVSDLPPQDRWLERLRLNALGCLALDNPALAKAMVEKGYDAPECQAALDREWRAFMVVGGYPTPAIDPDNNVLFALIILEDVILIEQVQAKRGGHHGGWGLVKTLVSRLVPWAKAYAIPAIRANATNEVSARLFEREGFVETKSDLFAETGKSRKFLRREVEL